MNRRSFTATLLTSVAALSLFHSDKELTYTEGVSAIRDVLIENLRNKGHRSNTTVADGDAKFYQVALGEKRYMARQKFLEDGHPWEIFVGREVFDHPHSRQGPYHTYQHISTHNSWTQTVHELIRLVKKI